MDDKEQRHLRILDTCFPYLQEYGLFDIQIVIPENIEFKEPSGLGYYPPSQIAELLKKYGYADIVTEGSDKYMYATFKAELTQRGRDAKKARGHFPYIEGLKQKEIAEKERQKLADNISSFDLLTKKFIYKSRFLPHIFSTAALIGTTFALYFSYQTLHKKEPTEKTTEQSEKTDTTKQSSKTATSFPLDSLLKKDSTKKQ